MSGGMLNSGKQRVPALPVQLALPDGGALLLLDDSALLVRNVLDGGHCDNVANGGQSGLALLLVSGVQNGVNDGLGDSPALLFGHFGTLLLVLGVLNNLALLVNDLE